MDKREVEERDEDVLDEDSEEESEDINNEDKEENTEESKKQNRVLAWVLVFVIVVIGSAVFVNYYSVSQKEFEYNGFNFTVLDEGDVRFYHTSFTIYNIKQVENSLPIRNEVNYNVYLRNNPKKLERISFNGKMNKMEMMVLNDSGEFNCEGDGVIAIANMNQILKAIGTKVIRDDNATCDEQGRYMFVNIQRGDKTSVEQYGPSCYNIYIDKCEILEGTERFVLEMFNDVGSV